MGGVKFDMIREAFHIICMGSKRREREKTKEGYYLSFICNSNKSSSPLGGSARAGVVTFSKRAEHSIKMSDHLDIKSFKAAVDDIYLMGSYTRIDRALRLAQKELFEVGSP